MLTKTFAAGTQLAAQASRTIPDYLQDNHWGPTSPPGGAILRTAMARQRKHPAKATGVFA
jgi:hypothetical protein